MRRPVFLFLVLTLTALPVATGAQMAPLPEPSEPAPTAPGWLGVTLESAETGGAQIERVLPSSPADRAGLTRGLTIVAVDGRAIDSAEHLVLTIGTLPAGATVEVEVTSDLGHSTVPVVLAPRPPDLTNAATLLVGTALPTLQLEDLFSGEPLALDSPTELLVIEFGATWCGPCHATIPTMTALRERWPAARLRMISVSSESPDDVHTFLDASPMPWEIAVDRDGEASSVLLVGALPTFFVIGGDRTIVDVFHSTTGVAALVERIDALLAEEPLPAAP